eukprot:TRINITY_DN15664_c0_g1_i1.p1 TRINITY_DN15664_c0_g1~~TRINITY_DN15664_c0_g1_i1.p1  ORF type:complete len:522 (-),score=70.00 TRINITY_DN15664_c0_g1_i1:76-1641(-)
MNWAEFSFPSPVDDIIKRASFTLEDLLDEDDVVHDIRSQKEELKEYLLKKESLTRLVQYVTQDAPSDASESVKYRYPVVAYEILISEIDKLDRELVQNEDLLGRLFKFFQNPNANPLLANLVIRVICSLMNSRLAGVLDYIKKNPQTLEDIIPFLHVASVFEFLHRLVFSVESEYEGKGTLDWLTQINFHKSLLSKFHPESAVIHPEISRLMVEILLTSGETSPLLQKVTEPESLDTLFEKIFLPNNPTGFRYGMTVISYMLRSLNPEFRGFDNISADAPTEQLPLVVQKVIQFLPKLMENVLSPPSQRMITNQLGQTVEAFGFIRVTILQCLDHFLALGYTTAINEVVSSHSDFLASAFELILQFSMNNFCHLVVGRILASIISLADDDTIIEYIKKSSLPQALIAHSNDVTPTTPHVLYAPFIFRIGFILVQRQQTLDTLNSLLNSIDGWEEFATRSIDENNKYLQPNPFGDSYDDDDTDDKTLSISDEESDDSSNDAHDYDTSQAEILLSKLEIEAAA